MVFRVAVLILLFFPLLAWSAGLEPFPDLNSSNPAAVREATRVLEEEVKLAAKPQTYVILDLTASNIRIKARGVDLYTMAIPSWSLATPGALTGNFRLIARPQIVRRKIDPTATEAQEPISLADMPTDYTLAFQPPLHIEIHSLKEEGVWDTGIGAAKTLWGRIQRWSTSMLSGAAPPAEHEPRLTVNLSMEHAQSLAWSAVDGMPLIIRQATTP